MRKTINDYRNCLARGVNNDTLSLLDAITYAIEKFGAGYGTHKAIYFDKETRSKNFNWNHTIKDIEVYNKKVILSVYWQGESTDGSKSICLTDAIKGTRIPAEYDNIGNRVVCRHSAIDVTREEVDKAIKALGEYISLDAIKAREKAKIKAEREKEMEMRVNGLCLGSKEDYSYGLRTEMYLNGKRAVNAVVKRDFDKLFNLKDEELKAILDKVYWQNHKSDNALGGWSKVYNLNY